MSTAVFDGKKRRLHWTCRYCGHSFKTWTRKGLRVTCPQCHRVQEGPVGVARLVDRKQPGRREATVLEVVAVNGAKHQAKKPAAPVRPQPKPPAKKASPPPPPSAEQQKDVISRIMGF